MTDDRLTIRDRADLARVAMLLQSHGYSIRNLDKCVERDSRDIVAIHRILCCFSRILWMAAISWPSTGSSRSSRGSST